MGLDPDPDAPSPEKIKVKVTKQKEKEEAWGVSVNKKLTHTIWRLIWLAGMVWMIFTTGIIGYAAVKIAESQMTSSEKES